MYRPTPFLYSHPPAPVRPYAAPPYDDDYDDDGLQQPPQHEYAAYDARVAYDDASAAYNAGDYYAAQRASCTDFADSRSPFCPEAPGELQPQMPAPAPYKEEHDDADMLWPDRTHDAGPYAAHPYDYEYDYAGSPYSESAYPDDTPSPLSPAPPPPLLPPYQQHRSYTLAAAITPLPSHAPPRTHARSPSPAPMASLRPPEPAPAPAPIKTEPELEPEPEPEPDPPRRPRGRPRKRPAAPLSREPLAFPYPQLLPGPAPSHSSSSAPPPRPASPVMGALLPPEAMSLDEVMVPDREGKPGQAIFKLTAVAGAVGAGGGAGREAPKKKPVMACLFCRERKIACGPPAPGSAEARCNQCTRRSLRCEYPKESRRGQHKRGPRAMRMQALADAVLAPGS